MKDIKIVDTTLRDGEQRAGIALGISEKVEIAKMLDELGIAQIEAGIPAMGGSERKSIQRIIDMGLKSKISVWNRLSLKDIQDSLQFEGVIIHISVPSSDMQIRYKLNKDRSWIMDQMRRCIAAAKAKGHTVTIGFEDASRAGPAFLYELGKKARAEGADRLRYADTVGVLHVKRVRMELKALAGALDMDFEIHAHDDLGMAAANSIAAVEAGITYVDTTIGGIGERAGNCDYCKFLYAARACYGAFPDIDWERVREVEQCILKKVRGCCA